MVSLQPPPPFFFTWIHLLVKLLTPLCFLSVCLVLGAVYAENAGGSQVLCTVAGSISEYLLSTNVQMAAYALAKQAETRVSLGTAAAAVLLGAESPDDVMIGQSATQLVASVALMIEHKVLADREAGVPEAWKEGDEIVISDADHETNRGAWTRMAHRLGLVVKHWPLSPIAPTADGEGEKENPYAVSLSPTELQNLVTPRTRLVAFTACSNVLGAFTPIREASLTIRKLAPAAVIAVDCVAFAPHRRLTPREWDVDLAFFSLYKTYGAHVGAMYIKPTLKQRSLQRLNHFFLQPPSAEIAGMYPFQTSSVQYELNYSIAAVADYLVSLGLDHAQIGQVKVDWNSLFARSPSQSTDVDERATLKLSRTQVESALTRTFAKIAAHESRLANILLALLARYYDRGVRVVGPQSWAPQVRAPTLAFVVVDGSTGRPRVGTSKRIHSALVQSGKLGAQQGHMYAHKLVQSLGLDLADGVVRLSFVHYNTAHEVEQVAQLLDSVLQQVVG